MFSSNPDRHPSKNLNPIALSLFLLHIAPHSSCHFPHFSHAAEEKFYLFIFASQDCDGLILDSTCTLVFY